MWDKHSRNEREYSLLQCWKRDIFEEDKEETGRFGFPTVCGLVMQESNNALNFPGNQCMLIRTKLDSDVTSYLLPSIFMPVAKCLAKVEQM